jgi:hypothetical protein
MSIEDKILLRQLKWELESLIDMVRATHQKMQLPKVTNWWA